MLNVMNGNCKKSINHINNNNWTIGTIGVNKTDATTIVNVIVKWQPVPLAINNMDMLLTV